MNMGVSIPSIMPQSTLACPPNFNFIKQYMPDVGPDGIITKFISKKPKKKIRLEDFASQYIAVQSVNGIFSNKIGSANDINSFKNRYQQTNLVFLNTSEIFLRKWVEVEKYGLGYILSNENVGVYFNDNTKIIYKPNGRNFIYIENENYSDIIVGESSIEEYTKINGILKISVKILIGSFVNFEEIIAIPVIPPSNIVLGIKIVSNA